MLVKLIKHKVFYDTELIMGRNSDNLSNYSGHIEFSPGQLQEYNKVKEESQTIDNNMPAHLMKLEPVPKTPSN